MIIQNMGGYQRTENGAYATATQVYLALFTGNVGHTGDGVYDVGGVSSHDRGGLRLRIQPGRPEVSLHPLRPSSGKWSWPTSRPRSTSLWIANGNIASQWPNSNMVKKALEAHPVRGQGRPLHERDTVCGPTWFFPVTAAVRDPERDGKFAFGRRVEISEARRDPSGRGQDPTWTYHARSWPSASASSSTSTRTPRCTSSACWNPPASRTTSWWRRRASTCGSATRAGSPTRTASSSRPPARHICGCRNGSTKGFPPIACHQRPAEHPLNAEGLAAKYPLAAVQRKLRTSVHTIFKNLDTMLDLDGHEPHVYPASGGTPRRAASSSGDARGGLQRPRRACRARRSSPTT